MCGRGRKFAGVYVLTTNQTLTSHTFIYVLWLGLLVPEMVALRCGADLGRRESADRIDWVGLLLPRDCRLEDGVPAPVVAAAAAAAAAPRRGFGGGRKELSSSSPWPARTKRRF